MSKKTKKNVIGHCPICGKTIEHVKEPELDAEFMFCPWTCKCGAKGTELYEIKFVKHLLKG